MIVRYEINVRQTCGSVRSSLSASAWLATAGSKAAEATYLCHLREHPACFHHFFMQRDGVMHIGSQIAPGKIRTAAWCSTIEE